jgi:hypothetical protein
MVADQFAEVSQLAPALSQRPQLPHPAVLANAQNLLPRKKAIASISDKVSVIRHRDRHRRCTGTSAHKNHLARLAQSRISRASALLGSGTYCCSSQLSAGYR